MHPFSPLSDRKHLKRGPQGAVRPKCPIISVVSSVLSGRREWQTWKGGPDFWLVTGSHHLLAVQEPGGDNRHTHSISALHRTLSHSPVGKTSVGALVLPVLQGRKQFQRHCRTHLGQTWTHRRLVLKKMSEIKGR